MIFTVIGIDPSFTACGVSDGERHIVIETKPRDGESQAAGLIRRCDEILSAVEDFIGPRNTHIFIEGAMATSRDAMHLYELGWLMSTLHVRLPGLFYEDRIGQVQGVCDVPIATLRKWATGNGNTAKVSMKLAVYKRFGIEFDKDPGCDKLFAYLLSRYGKALLFGEIEPTVPKRRGEGKRAQQIARGAMRT